MLASGRCNGDVIPDSATQLLVPAKLDTYCKAPLFESGCQSADCMLHWGPLTQTSFFANPNSLQTEAFLLLPASASPKSSSLSRPSLNKV